MHPFLPVLSLVFLLAADGAMLYLRLNIADPEVAAHVSSVYTVVLVSLLIGGGLAFWLRRFSHVQRGLRFPALAAVLSLAWIAALGLF